MHNSGLYLPICLLLCTWWCQLCVYSIIWLLSIKLQFKWALCGTISVETLFSLSYLVTLLSSLLIDLCIRLLSLTIRLIEHKNQLVIILLLILILMIKPHQLQAAYLRLNQECKLLMLKNKIKCLFMLKVANFWLMTSTRKTWLVMETMVMVVITQFSVRIWMIELPDLILMLEEPLDWLFLTNVLQLKLDSQLISSLMA